MSLDILENAPSGIINAVGYATRVGGSCPSAEVMQAMKWAQERYFEMDDLLEYSSHVIGRITGSEAGIVTCGASAGLTLGSAAILAGYDIAIMESLPDTSQLSRRTFLCPELNDYDYDHPVRASGAGLQVFSFSENRLEEHLLAAFSDSLAGVIYVWKHRDDVELIRRIALICRESNQPFLLDAAMCLPPTDNLRDIAALGANLVTLSGGKHLGGPQNSGLLFGDENLVRSAWLQMVDMDVRPGSWSQAHLLDRGILPRPPRHGIGRGFKVGKDTILGCLAALELYSSRDFAAERDHWHRICRHLVDRIASSSLLRLTYLPENGTGQYPVVELVAASPEVMRRLKYQLKSDSPKIILAEHEGDASIAYIYPMCLKQIDVDEIILRFSQIESS